MGRAWERGLTSAHDRTVNESPNERTNPALTVRARQMLQRIALFYERKNPHLDGFPAERGDFFEKLSDRLQWSQGTI